METSRPSDQIRAKALELGFDAVAITKPDVSARDQDRLRDFVANGEHGDMGWMAEKLDRRIHPTAIWSEVRSVIILAANYGPDHDPMTSLEMRDRGNISVYARGRDYHNVIKKRQRKLARWMADQFGCDLKIFVDTAPVMEKPLAARSGLGWQGKHSNLVTRDFGSWIFLGEIFTDMELAPDPPEPPEPDRCGSCQACIDVCPTAAITAPYQVDARRCISYLTIEHKGPIPIEFRSAMGNRIYGCDDCLAVCPWNRFAKRALDPSYHDREGYHLPDLAELAGLDDEAFREKFSGSPIKRTGRDRFLRNVMIAIGNSQKGDMVQVVSDRLDDTSPLVRGAAVWALGQLASDHLQKEYDRRFSLEKDEQVREEWKAVSALSGRSK